MRTGFPDTVVSVMAESRLKRIRKRIRLREYDISAHAMEEMAEDLLDVLDVESAILTGQITRIEKHDPRGTKYVILRRTKRTRHPDGVARALGQAG